MCMLLGNVDKRPCFKSVIKKYSTAKFLEVAKIMPNNIGDNCQTE